ncbi:MAG: hypothetical protein IKA82_02030 [Clostridia bacterium]|nr:hypothetical protein [Clostridia bacterium]
MITLNLTATTTEEKVLKEYLEQNVSEILADKINNGVPVEKDGKQLISRKTLAGFMKFATEEAKNQAENGATSACVHSEVVFGWAIHYFEEDSILGTLYNEDGTEYKAPKPAPKPKKAAASTTATDTKTTTPAVSAPTPKKVNPTGQLTMFDFMDEPTEDETPTDKAVEDAVVEVTEQPTEFVFEDDEEEPATEETPPEKPKILPLYEKYQHYQAEFPNTVVAMRVGDFFEIFGEVAVTVARELSMTLTSRDCGLSERVPMIGYPFHVADTYREKIRAFANIAVIDGEQMNFYPKIEAEISLPPNYAIIEETGEIVELPAVEESKEPQNEEYYADMDLMYKIYMLLDQKIDIVK